MTHKSRYQEVYDTVGPRDDLPCKERGAGLVTPAVQEANRNLMQWFAHNMYYGLDNSNACMSVDSANISVAAEEAEEHGELGLGLGLGLGSARPVGAAATRSGEQAYCVEDKDYDK